MILTQHGVENKDDNYLNAVIGLVKERMTFVEDFWEQASFFFQRATTFDADAVKPKWNSDKSQFFTDLTQDFEQVEEWTAAVLEPLFKNKIAESGMKVGELMMPFRIMLVGGKFGPDVFQITALLGKEEVCSRIHDALPHFE